MHGGQGWLGLEHWDWAVFILIFRCKRRVLLVFDLNIIGLLLVAEAGENAFACLD